MARLKLLRFSLTAIKGFDKDKAISFINLIIFISFFALTASVVSMYYENKIDQIDNQIINEETNILIYENQIKITPIILKNIEDIFYDNYKIDDYLKLLELWSEDDSSLVTSRHTIFKPYWGYESAANYGLEQMKQSISDAILVANNSKDIKEIELNNVEFRKIDEEIRKIIRSKEIIDNEWALKEREKFSNQEITIAEEKEEYYQKFLPLNNKLIDVLQDQINFFINFNIKYFDRKKIETENSIKILESNLKKISKQEALIILTAFLLQLIIFISVQYFEITMETANAKRTKKK